jgi:hypothetical protein
MSRGFVLKLKRIDAEGDEFAIAYEALKGACFPKGTQWLGWRETDIRLPRPFDNEAMDPLWDVVCLFSSRAELRVQRRGSKRLVLLLTEDEALVNQLMQGLEGFAVTRMELIAEPGYRVLIGEKPRTANKGILKTVIA